MRVLKSLLLLEEATKKGGIVSPKEIYDELTGFIHKFSLKMFLMRNYLDILPNWVPNTENDVQDFFLIFLIT